MHGKIKTISSLLEADKIKFMGGGSGEGGGGVNYRKPQPKPHVDKDICKSRSGQKRASSQSQ